MYAYAYTDTIYKDIYLNKFISELVYIESS